MNATISPEQLSGFFAVAPLLLGIIIYTVAWASKRNEGHDRTVPIGQTFACAGCGKRSVREHMVPQAHEGAVSYYCTKCASTARAV